MAVPQSQAECESNITYSHLVSSGHLTTHLSQLKLFFRRASTLGQPVQLDRLLGQRAGEFGHLFIIRLPLLIRLLEIRDVVGEA